MSEMDREQLVARIVRFGKEYLRLLIRIPSVDPLSEEFGRLVIEEGALIEEFADDIEDHGEYEARMDELLCRLINGKWSKSRSYSVDFMASCIDEAYEEAYAGDSATVGGGECEWECPLCRRIGRVDPAEDYAPGEKIRMSCPNCGGKIVVLCVYKPTFVGCRPESFGGDA